MYCMTLFRTSRPCAFVFPLSCVVVMFGAILSRFDCKFRGCTAPSKSHWSLLNTPDVLTLNLVYPDKPSQRTGLVSKILDCLGGSVRLSQLFDNAPGSTSGGTPVSAADGSPVGRVKHSLRGMICFVRLHYVAWFWGSNGWVLCDDAVVETVSLRAAPR